MIAIVEAFFIVWFSGGGDFKVSFMFFKMHHIYQPLCYFKYLNRYIHNGFLKWISTIWDLNLSSLYLNKNERVCIGKCNVSQGLRHQPYSISCTRSWDSSNAALNISILLSYYYPFQKKKNGDNNIKFWLCKS